jgi:NADH-quinone oxidoreductase subunit F
MRLMLARIDEGQGTMEDLDTLLDVCDNILGRAFCALGDGATSPVTSSIELFRVEYEAHITEHRCPFDPAAAALFDYTPRPARVLTAGVH